MLEREGLERDPGKAVSSAYAFILKQTLSPRSFAPARNWMAALEVLEQGLVEDGAEKPPSRPAEGEQSETRYREMT